MNLRGKKVLVTGADGFIGSHLTEYLVRFGCDVTAFVMYNSFNSWGWLDDSKEEIKHQLRVVSGDIRDAYGVRRAMEGQEVVFHLAALIAIPFSYTSPATYVETNVTGTLNVVQAARDMGVEKLVNTSTSEVYGTAKYVPIDEAHPLQGQSPYSASKIGADHIAMSFYHSFSTPVATVRPFNTYGPRQSARAVIPTIITQVAAGQDQIQLGSLHPTRDFNFVQDTVRGFVSMAESERSVGEIINIGSNYEVSIGDTAHTIARLMGKDVTVVTDDLRLRPDKSEVERLWADNSKAKQMLGWEPVYGGLDGFERGLKETIAFFMEPQNLQRYKTGIYNI
ncbi:NAD-dependent 4,6-dehydratase LegB [Paenibacillus sp. GCM10027628]|uniref:NAD-dependent 4,6-dehydratase LegB n=1 Tax=Paenibacillus sp. GCM10027628 TaxID=3273413 RepID=UPI0036420AC7